jgi:pimeloyl-ACP methyl ester carboxylesterase
VVVGVTWLLVACSGEGGAGADASDLQAVDAQDAADGWLPDGAEPAADVRSDATPDVPFEVADAVETTPDARPDSVPDAADVSDDAETTAPAILWGVCPQYIAYTPDFECAFVPVPLDYDQPEGASISVFVYRLRVTSPAKKRQVWFLQGGPGGSGADFAQVFLLFSMAHPEWELYSLDHRGVGNTARLTCPQEGDAYDFDFAGCAESLVTTWGGDGLAQFTTTNAARDVGRVIDLAREPGVPVLVYGASYGTYWGLRYLQLFPEQADGVILDSICAPGACHLDEYDQNFNENGKQILAACATDATCAAKLGPLAATPWEALGVVFDRADAGTLCNGAFPFLDRPTLRLVLAMLEMDASTRVLIPALVYRLTRCDANDRAVLEYFVQTLQQAMGGASLPLSPSFVGEDQLDGSMTLGTHVIVAELLGTKTHAEVQAIVDAAYFSADASPSMLEMAESGAWPVTPDDGYMNRWGETATPLLMLNGTLDPQTTLAMAQPAGDHYVGAHQTFVAVDYAAHGVLFASHTNASVQAMMQGSYDYMFEICGYRMFEGFVADPTAPIDTTCLADLYPLEFSAQSPMNQYLSSYLLGTEDMYEGGVTRTARPDRPPFALNPVAGWPLRPIQRAR